MSDFLMKQVKQREPVSHLFSFIQSSHKCGLLRNLNSFLGLAFKFIYDFSMRVKNFLVRNERALFALFIVVTGLQLWTFGNSTSANAAPNTTQLNIPAGLLGVNDISVSADGTKLVIVSGSTTASPISNKIHYSTNSGATWIETTPATLLQTTPHTPTWVVSNSSGQKVVVTSYTSGIIHQSNDYGATWSQRDLNPSFKSSCSGSLNFLNHNNLANPQSTGVAMSPDGTIIVLNVFNSTCMLVSSDSGLNFSKITLPASVDKQGAIQISQTQNAIWFAKSNTAGTGGGGLWKLNMTNWQWSGNYSGTVGLPRGLTGSADGTIMYTAGGSGYNATGSLNFSGPIYRSTDSGGTFTQVAGTSKNWLGIRASGDGAKLIGWTHVNNLAGSVWISEDSGANWIQQDSPGTYINSVDFSADGTVAYMTMGYYNVITPTTRVYKYTFPTPSTTTLSTQNFSAVYGGANTFTATISPNTATGSVVFKKSDGSTFCTSSVVSGVATCSTWKPNVGDYTGITAVYGGDSNFGGSTSGSASFSVSQAPLTITASSPTVTYGTTAPTITATYSGLVNGEASSVVTGLTCSSTYTTTSSVGSLPVTRCSGGTNGNYLISYVDGSVIINKATPVINAWNSNWRSRTYGNGNFTLEVATANVAGTFTYTSGSPSVISLNGRTATVAGAGTSIVIASFTPTDETNYESTASASLTFTVLKDTPSLTWSDVSKYMGDASFTLNAPTSTTSGTFTYTSATPSVVSLNGDTASVAAIGTSVITAIFTPTDTNNYGTATKAMTITVVATAQTITRTSISPTSPIKSGTYTPTATSSSSLAVAITIASGSSSVCSISGGIVTFNAVGSCVIQYNQSGDASYSAATQVTESLTIGKATPTFTWSSTSKTFGDATFTVTAPTVTGSLGGSFSYSSANTSVISVSGTTFTVVGSGASVITATFTPTDATNYNSATMTMTITVGASAQTITRTSMSPTSPVKSGTYTPTATASSSLTVSIAIASESVNVCSIASGVVTFNAAGNCVINYNQSGNTNYSAATQATETLSVGKETPTFSAWSNVSKVYENGDFTLTAPTVTGSLPGTFTYSSATSSVISLVGNLATVAGAGTSVITATFTPTDSTNYNATTTTMTVTVAKVSPRFSTSNVSKAFGAAPFSLSYPYVFRNLTGTFTFSSADTSVISLNGRIATVVGVGTSVITATFTPDDTNNYLSGATTTLNVTVTQGAQSVALVIDSTSVTYGSTLSLTTTGGSGSGALSFIVDSGPCTVSTTTLSTTAAGICLVTANKEAAGNYLAASSTSTAITVNPKGLTISGLTGVNKEFDGTRVGAATGTPTLVGVVGSDNVLIGGTPVFTFASANVGSGVSLASSGYTLTETTAANYTLTQPTLAANITQKSARVAANNVTIAFGGTITSGVTASGLIAPDAVGSASYTYTGTGTSTPPTAVGVYTVTPSSAVLSTGTIGNYSISYDTATVTILAKYTITYNANGGQVSVGSTLSNDFVVGDAAITLPTTTRDGFNFLGWYTHQTNGVQVTGAYTPTATATLWAHWIQKSLVGIGNSQRIGTITTLANVGNTYSATSTSGTVAVTYAANALPVGTVIDIYQMSDSSRASSLISSTHSYVLSLVIAWLTPTNTVPILSSDDALTMVITDSAIKKGARVYSLVGSDSTLLGTATADGSVTVRILEDPEVYVAITKPDAPTGVSATSGGNASITVSWTAPSDGGSAITSYTATSNAGHTCTSATTSCSITGLTNGSPYTFTVTATNAIGTSDASSASGASTPAAPVVISAPVVAPTPDPAVIAALAAAKVAAEKAAAEAIAAAAAKAAADKKAADEAELAAIIKALQEQAAAEAAALAAAKKATDELRIAEELRIAQEKADAALKAAAEKKALEDAAAAAAKKITTVYSTTAAFKLNPTYSKRLTTYSKKIAAGSTVTCIGYAKSSKTLSYAKAKVVASKQAKALCSSMKKINPTLKTKSTVLPASKTPVTSVNKKWIPVSYRVQAPVN
jgi:aspartate 1-decarboxylase